VFSWAFRDESRRLEAMRRWMGMAFRLSHARGHAYVHRSGAGAALWAPPDVGFFDDEAFAELVAIGDAIDPAWNAVALEGLSSVGALHPEGPPHFYLHAIGVAPSHRSQGIGAALLERVLRVCDEEGLPAYLESSNPRNLTLYERAGFAVTGEVAMPDGGPVVRPMWRGPQVGG
jgi:GNAT superfamily N-acetyltransferase